MSHIWMSVVTHMSDSYHKRTLHVTHMRHVTHMSKSRHAHECVMSHIEWVISHIPMSHVPHMHESRHTYEWHTAFVCVTHVIFFNSGGPHNQFFWRENSIFCDSLKRIRMRHSWHLSESRHVSSRGFANSIETVKHSDESALTVLQWVAVSCSVLQRVVRLIERLHNFLREYSTQTSQHPFCCSELQWVAVSCSELQWLAVSCTYFHEVFYYSHRAIHPDDEFALDIFWLVLDCLFFKSRTIQGLFNFSEVPRRIIADCVAVSCSVLQSAAVSCTYHREAFQFP